MIKILHSGALKKVAERLVWFKKPEETLEDPYLFLAHVMTYGTLEDVAAVKQNLGIEAFREALDNMPPGIMDSKSWNYWNLITGTYPVPPQPSRKID